MNMHNTKQDKKFVEITIENSTAYVLKYIFLQTYSVYHLDQGMASATDRIMFFYSGVYQNTYP